MQETIPPTTARPPSILKTQIIPLALTIITALALIGILTVEVIVLNAYTLRDIVLHFNVFDVLLGITIYLKTSIDFAIYIGNLMAKNRDWRHRIAIEVGTAAGNAVGTMFVVILWAFFKEITWLLVAMIVLASIVLLKLAEDGLEHARTSDDAYPRWFRKTVTITELFLATINRVTAPVVSLIIPNVNARTPETLTFGALFILAFTVPFVLGLDDFAGYVALFNVINVYGFAIGVILAHMTLNILLYISPRHTIAVVKNAIISLIGSLAFIGIALWGLFEALTLTFKL
jgi:hypothetical protein